MGVIYRSGKQIGPAKLTNAAAAGGIWDLREVDARRRLSLWPEQIVKTGLVLHYDAAIPESVDFGATGTINDLSPTGATGTWSPGAANWISDGGGALDFDNTASNHIATNFDGPNSLAANNSGSWSVEVWFNFVAPSPAGVGYALVGRGGGLGTVSTFVVGLAGTGNWGGVARTQNNLVVLLRGTSTQISGGSLSGAGWKQVVITWDGTTANVYLDGSFVQTASVGAAATQVTTIQIGRVAGTAYYNNYISNVKIYDVALSATDVAQNFNALRNRYGI